MKQVVLSMCVIAMLAACGGDDDSTSMSGMSGGTGGTGSGGAGSGGMGATGGAGGTGAATGGTGVAGMGGAPVTDSCMGADTSAGGPALYAAAAGVLNVQSNVPNATLSPCAFSSCHKAPSGKAMLVLMDAADFKATLVSKPSCEAPMIPLVDPAGGDAGLMNSWLWLKLTAPADSNGVITSQAAWGAGGASCGQMGGQPFGVRMPWGNTGDMLLTTEKLEKIRAWICGGAPGAQ